jgi:hypothetical protein
MPAQDKATSPNRICFLFFIFVSCLNRDLKAHLSFFAAARLA